MIEFTTSLASFIAMSCRDSVVLLLMECLLPHLRYVHIRTVTWKTISSNIFRSTW